jgi:hypothetical protein
MQVDGPCPTQTDRTSRPSLRGLSPSRPLPPERERAHKSARYSTVPGIKATSMIGTGIGGTNHESSAPRNGGRNPAPVRPLIHDRSCRKCSTLRGSLVVVHAIAIGVPLPENFFPFHWKFCILIINALNDLSMIMRYVVTGLVLEPSA